MSVLSSSSMPRPKQALAAGSAGCPADAGVPHAIDGLPPGLPWPPVLQWLMMVLRFDTFNERLRRLGTLVTLRFPGLGTIVSAADPQLIKQVFTGDRDVLHAGEANAPLAAVLGRNSVLLLDGERHLQRRRMLLPPFHGEAVRGYADVVAQITEDEVRRWPRGAEFAVWPRMQAITLEVIMRVVIGVRDEQRLARMRTLLLSVQHNSIYAVVAEGARPGLSASPLGRRLPWVRARAKAERVLDQEIAAHRRRPDGREEHPRAADRRARRGRPSAERRGAARGAAHAADRRI